MCGESSGSNPKLSKVENERRIKAPPEVDLTWSKPDARQLEKLKYVANVHEEEDWFSEEEEGPSAEEKRWYSEEETEEIGYSLTRSSEEEGTYSEDETKEIGLIKVASELDAGCWSALGDDLLENVIVRLSLHSLFRVSSPPNNGGSGLAPPHFSMRSIAAQQIGGNGCMKMKLVFRGLVPIWLKGNLTRKDIFWSLVEAHLTWLMIIT